MGSRVGRGWHYPGQLWLPVQRGKASGVGGRLLRLLVGWLQSLATCDFCLRPYWPWTHGKPSQEPWGQGHAHPLPGGLVQQQPFPGWRGLQWGPPPSSTQLAQRRNLDVILELVLLCSISSPRCWVLSCAGLPWVAAWSPQARGGLGGLRSWEPLTELGSALLFR